jgi:hypothetical protein
MPPIGETVSQPTKPPGRCLLQESHTQTLVLLLQHLRLHKLRVLKPAAPVSRCRRATGEPVLNDIKKVGRIEGTALAQVMRHEKK